MEPVAAFFPPSTGSQRQQQPHHEPQMTQTFHSEAPTTPFASSQQLLTRHASSRSGPMSPGSSYSQRDELPPLPVPDFDPYMLVGTAPTPANRKAAEAAFERRNALAREQSMSGHSYGHSSNGAPNSYNYYNSMPNSSAGSAPGLRRGPSSAAGSGQGSQSAPSVVGTDDDGAIIVQHRDGGMPQPVVELPPSYDPGSYRRPPSGMHGAIQYPPEKQR